MHITGQTVLLITQTTLPNQQNVVHVTDRTLFQTKRIAQMSILHMFKVWVSGNPFRIL